MQQMPTPAVNTLVNSRRVEIRYELTRAASSGLRGADVWLTVDAGRTWERYGGDGRNEGRREGRYARMIELPDREGVYGVILVVRSEASRSRPDPKAGEAPEALVEVDVTPPTAQLYRPLPGPGDARSWVLKWEADDKNLAATPISLEFAETADGPWRSIAMNRRNTGRHEWTRPEGTPAAVYLRLRVRDRAGNEAVATTPIAVNLDPDVPESRILNILPAPGKEESGER